MENWLVWMSRSAIPCPRSASITSAMAAELASRAALAVSASRVTVSCSRAMSGASWALPWPLTMIRGVGSSSAAQAPVVNSSTSVVIPRV